MHRKATCPWAVFVTVGTAVLDCSFCTVPESPYWNSQRRLISQHMIMHENQRTTGRRNPLFETKHMWEGKHAGMEFARVPGMLLPQPEVTATERMVVETGGATGDAFH